MEEFSELGIYLREPVKSYSSGMRARLAFAISMVIEFDCFLIDEIVAVGDSRFHTKCDHELFVKRGDRAMIIVSHNAAYIREHCTRAAVLKDGRLHHHSDLDGAFALYRRSGIGGMRRLIRAANAGARQAWLWRHGRAFGDRPDGSRRVSWSCTAIMRHDAQTGIQRVVRAVWSELRQRDGRGFDLTPVYASTAHGYCYAPTDFLERRHSGDWQEPVRVAAGDKFLGLDLSAHLLPKYRRQLKAWRAHGATIHMVVYDLLPLERGPLGSRTLQSATSGSGSPSSRKRAIKRFAFRTMSPASCRVDLKAYPALGVPQSIEC